MILCLLLLLFFIAAHKNATKQSNNPLSCNLFLLLHCLHLYPSPVRLCSLYYFFTIIIVAYGIIIDGHSPPTLTKLLKHIVTEALTVWSEIVNWHDRHTVGHVEIACRSTRLAKHRLNKLLKRVMSVRR